MEEALLKGCVEAGVAEALANYALADEPLSKSYRWKPERVGRGRTHSIYHDSEFWDYVVREQFPLELDFYCVALTEWVARVPGLYWRDGSAQRRQVDPSRVLFRTDRHVTYTPRGKSQVVTGGIGTLRFPPADDGYRLATLSTVYNASSGIPTLVSPEVWDAQELSEGSVLQIEQAACRDMPLAWAKRFPITSGLRRACVVLDDIKAIRVVERKAPVIAHPSAVMEYQEGDAQLHDFVFVTANTNEKTLRGDVSTFFEHYRKDRGREGTYLTSADIANPMWDAMFDDPADMRLNKAPQLRLIEQRVEEAATGQDVTEALIRKLCSLDAPSDLKRLSEKADIPYRRWWTEGSPLADAAQRLVDVAIQSDKHLALLHVVHLELAS